MMIIGVVIAVAVLAFDSPPQPIVTETHIERTSINIPDEIGPAIAPYLTCRILAAGSELRVDSKVVAANKPSLAECEAKKEQAVEYSHKLLKKQGMSDKGERVALIDKTMAEVEVFADKISDTYPPANLDGANESAEHPAIESKVASGSIVIPDEIAPAVAPYVMCLNKAINDEVAKAGGGATAEQMPLIEAAALQACRADRDAATAKADKLLQAYDRKMEPAARATKIENTLVSNEAMFTGMAEKMEQTNATPPPHMENWDNK